MNFQRLVTNLLEAWIGSETSIAALARLELFKKDTPQETGPAEPAELPQDWPFSGAVDFTGVSSRLSTC